MLDKLIDFVTQFVDLFFFVRIVDEYEQGVVLRFGRYRRTLKPGAHFVWPLAIERVVTQTMAPHVHHSGVQCLSCSDGTPVAVQLVTTWRCVDARKLLLELDEAGHAVYDLVSSEVQRVVAQSPFAADTEELLKQVTRAARLRAKRYGIEIERVRFSEWSKAKVLRVMGGT